MVDIDTFLTTLYVMIDDFCKSELPTESKHPGPQASLSRSEVMTLALFGQWTQFPSERAFYRYATHHFRGAFPRLPDRSQFNRLERQHRDAITAFALSLVDQMQAQDCPYEALDSTAAATRDAKRRGLGWLPGQADIGWSNRVGWYEGFHVLVAVTPDGVITGFGFGSASTHDHPLATTLFAVRTHRPLVCRVLGNRLTASTLPIKALQALDPGVSGKSSGRPRSFLLLIGVASEIRGPKRCVAGLPAVDRSLKRSMTSS